MKKVQEESVAQRQEAPASRPGNGFDPYSSATQPEAKKEPRRTLDDMRRLSEEIKKARDLKS